MAGSRSSWLGGLSRVRRTLGLALAQLSLFAALVGLIVVVLVVEGPIQPSWALVLFPLVGAIWFSVGVVAWWRRPSNRIGGLLTLGGFMWLAVGLGNSGSPPLTAVGLVLATVPFAVVVHLVLAFPSGRLQGAVSRGAVAAGYVVALVLQAPQYLFLPESPPFDVLQVADAPQLARVGIWLQQGAGAVVMGATAMVVTGRLRAASPAHRRVLGAVYGYSIAAVLLVPLLGNFARAIGLSPIALAVVQLGVLALIPIVFASSLRRGFARTVDVEELAEWLGASADRPQLRAALVAALGDPSLQLLFWLPTGYVDDSGRQVTLPAGDDRRAVADIELAGEQVGAIIYDATLIPDAEPVRAAGRVIAIEVDRERLTAQLRASREALRQSRQRLVEAGDRRQERIARDLHDGLQNRLVALALAAHRAGAIEVRRGLEDAIDELRALVAGMMPPLLIERGLPAAARDLVERMPVPVRLEMDGHTAPLSATVEQTAYLVLSEALTNIIKHAHASDISVRLDHRMESLRLEIRDDGIGGATLTNGAGLRGIADRVDVAGGRLRIESQHGRGTRLVAELPCAS